MSAFGKNTAAARGLSSCHVCGLLSASKHSRCPRCGAAVHLRTPHSLQKTTAFLIAAAVLFLPANLLPIMFTEQLGSVHASTIIGGVLLLWEHGSYPIAAVIFIASVFIPLAKIMMLAWLAWSVSKQSKTKPRQRTALYRATELVGRWSMVDVFVVAILVALIQLGGVLTIRAGAAALAFCGVVMVTMLAAHSFDSRLIWDTCSGEEADHDHR